MLDRSDLDADGSGVLIPKPHLKLGRAYTRLKDREPGLKFADNADEDRVSSRRKVLKRCELSADTMLSIIREVLLDKASYE